MKIADAKRILPLPKLIEHLDEYYPGLGSTTCPFHIDARPSFSFYLGNDGSVRWKCHAGCGSGDQIDYLALHHQISQEEAVYEFIEMAREFAACEEEHSEAGEEDNGNDY